LVNDLCRREPSTTRTVGVDAADRDRDRDRERDAVAVVAVSQQRVDTHPVILRTRPFRLPRPAHGPRARLSAWAGGRTARRDRRPDGRMRMQIGYKLFAEAFGPEEIIR
jgi:hypothetical protein